MRRPPKTNELARSKAAERQQQERERQIAMQRSQAQSALDDYQKALSRASQAGADRLAPRERSSRQYSLATHAKEKFNQGNYAGAQADFAEALRQLESAIRRAEEVARQRRQEVEGSKRKRLRELRNVTSHSASLAAVSRSHGKQRYRRPQETCGLE